MVGAGGVKVERGGPPSTLPTRVGPPRLATESLRCEDA